MTWETPTSIINEERRLLLECSILSSVWESVRSARCLFHLRANLSHIEILRNFFLSTFEIKFHDLWLFTSDATHDTYIQLLVENHTESSYLTPCVEFLCSACGLNAYPKLIQLMFHAPPYCTNEMAKKRMAASVLQIKISRPAPNLPR